MAGMETSVRVAPAAAKAAAASRQELRAASLMPSTWHSCGMPTRTPAREYAAGDSSTRSTLMRGEEHTPSRPSAPENAAYTAATSSTQVPTTAGQSSDEAYLAKREEAGRGGGWGGGRKERSARYETVAADAAVARLEPNDFAVCGRKSYAAARVAAEGDAHYSIGDGSSAAAAAASRHFGGVAGVCAAGA